MEVIAANATFAIYGFIAEAYWVHRGILKKFK